MLPVRSIVRMRSYAPATLLAVAVAAGQGIAWFLSLEHITVVVCIVSLLSATRIRRLEPVLSGVLVGLLTGAIAASLHSSARVALDGSLLIRVEESPRRPRPDQIVFVGRDLLSASRERLRCTAVELPWRHAAQVRQGSVVWIRGEVVSVSRPVNPFSWEGWLWRNGISGTVKVRYISSPLDQDLSFLEQARSQVARRVRDALDDRRGGALFLSMAFGFRDVLSAPVEDAFTALGLKHLLVVSGYQVSLVFGVFLGSAICLLRRIRLSRGTRATAAVCAFISSMVFVAFIGLEMSALRALVAAACMCATKLFECAGRFAQRWGVALLIVELLSPWALFDMGVQLTFAALAGIGIGARLGQGSAGKSFLWVTVSAWVLTSTVMLAWNGTLSFVGLPLNLTVAVPWSFLNCVVGGCGVMLLMIVEDWGRWIVWLVAWCNEAIASALFLIAESPLRAVTLEGRWRALALVLGVAAALILGWRASRRSSMLALVSSSSTSG